MATNHGLIIFHFWLRCEHCVYAGGDNKIAAAHEGSFIGVVLIGSKYRVAAESCALFC